MSRKDGGNAFPYSALTPDGPKMYTDSEGMTLRDYFAGQVVCGRMARNSNYRSWDDAAKDAYELADAMLKERNKCQE